MSQISCKKIISIIACILIILSIILPYFESSNVIAATVNQTTEKRNHGFKVPNAKWYPELFDKYSVIGPENSGGSGGGGGAGNSKQSHAGNNGTSNEAGGVFGKSAGQGLGTGTTGSKTADAMLAQMRAIEESRQESIAKVIESAVNESIARESIRIQESIDESNRKKYFSERVKQSLAAKETSTYETPGIELIETQKATTRELDIKDQTKAPTKSKTSETIAEIAPSEITISSAEPGDSIEETEPKNVVTSKALIVQIEVPTGEQKYEEPDIEIIPTKEQVEKNENAPTKDANVDSREIEEGMKGGMNAEADEDMSGEAGKEESAGNAQEYGRSQAEDYGENGGKKIFELDRDGNIGLNKKATYGINRRLIIILSSSLILILGVTSYLLSMRDKKDKKNYF